MRSAYLASAPGAVIEATSDGGGRTWRMGQHDVAEAIARHHGVGAP